MPTLSVAAQSAAHCSPLGRDPSQLFVNHNDANDEVCNLLRMQLRTSAWQTTPSGSPMFAICISIHFMFLMCRPCLTRGQAVMYNATSFANCCEKLRAFFRETSSAIHKRTALRKAQLDMCRSHGGRANPRNYFSGKAMANYGEKNNSLHP